MDVVVADATPLNYLILIDAAEVLPQLFTNIHIPIEVLTELSSNDAPEIVRLWIQRLPAWINVHRSEEIGAGDAAVNILDSGERAAILLAESLRADLLLIDEREGATLAERRGLAVTGTLGLLDLAASRGLIDLRDAFARLQKTNFRYPPSLIEKILKEDEGRKK